MIKLSEASIWFDQTEAKDPDNGSVLFRCQLTPYDDSKRDAGGAYRRVMSVAPGTALPAGKAVRIHGQVWLIGTKEVDGFLDPHRDKYVLQQAAPKVNISRLSGYLTGTVAQTAWAGVEWTKDVREEETSSRVANMHNVLLPAGTDLRERDVVWFGSEAYLCIGVHTQASGFVAGYSVRLDRALETATRTVRVYDPSAGAYMPSAPASLPALVVRWQSLYQYGSEADARYQEGDAAIVLRTSDAVQTSDLITAAGSTWKVLSIDTLSGADVAHARPQ